jgi:L-threonylcarbamoyladenylate synthase
VGGDVEVFQSEAELRDVPVEALPSPGVGLRHYAPKARLVLVEGSIESLAKLLIQQAERLDGERLGVMLPAEVEFPVAWAEVYAWGRWSAPEELARNLYAGLRELDGWGCTTILCPVPAGEGIGEAIRDRLRKAGNREREARTRD